MRRCECRRSWYSRLKGSSSPWGRSSVPRTVASVLDRYALPLRASALSAVKSPVLNRKGAEVRRGTTTITLRYLKWMRNARDRSPY